MHTFRSSLLIPFLLPALLIGCSHTANTTPSTPTTAVASSKTEDKTPEAPVCKQEDSFDKAAAIAANVARSVWLEAIEAYNYVASPENKAKAQKAYVEWSEKLRSMNNK